MSRTSHHRPRRATLAPRARPLLLAAALAGAFGAAGALAQPSGATSVHGTATVTQQGSTTTIATTNGAGTQHSVIDWRSFSVPSGTTTRIVQPSAVSTSINRVTGPDPSLIYGTLWSNGRVVVVNPHGITVGAGAVVDTAAFTASTLRMTDADALMGRMRFGDGLDAGALRVEGGAVITGRQGDIVLLAPSVEVGQAAAVRSDDGSVVLAAGRKAELTGRGLEGIRLEVQAPADAALNLGRLEGDAVGIFAGTLRHSGLARASSVHVEGGRVVLRAQGDALVDGTVEARAGGAGGRVDVLGQRVALQAGATVDVRGTTGAGGSVRIGGGFQGRDADVRNAERTYVDRDARILADAGAQGDGGRVIVWADQSTRSYGTVSARGGAQGGDGGFVEISGKHGLDFDSQVDTRAPVGRTGTLLLDPDSITVVSSAGVNLTDVDQFSDPGGTLNIGVTTINGATANVVLQANNDITIAGGANINMANGGVGFTAQAGRNLTVDGSITTSGGAIELVAGDAGSAASPPHTSSALRVNAALGSGGGAVTLKSRFTDAGDGVRVNAAVNAGAGLLTVAAPTVAVTAAGSLQRTGTGDLRVEADSVDLLGGVTSTGGRAVFMSAVGSGGRQMELAGSASDTTHLALSTAELAQISAGTLVVGEGTRTGNIVIGGNMGGSAALSLITQGNISQTGALTMASLNADGGSVSLTNSGNTVGTLSGKGTSGSFFFTKDSSALTIGTVDGQNGITAGGSVMVSSNGSIDVTQAVSGSSVTIQGPTGVNVRANVTANAGSVLLQAAGAGANLVFNPTGTIEVKGTSASSFSAANAINFTSGTTKLSQSVGSTGALNIVSGGTVSIDGTVSLANVNLAGGTITNGGTTDNLTISGAFNWSGGNLFGNNAVTLAGTSNVSANVQLNRPLVNSGTLNMTGTGFITQSGGYDITNTSSGIWDIQTAAGGGVSLPASRSFINAGTVKNTGGSSTSALTAGTVTNQAGGTIQVDSGTLQLGSVGGTVDNHGTLKVALLATAASPASNFNNHTTGQIEGMGTLSLSSGTGTLTNAGAIAPGGVGTVGTFTLNGNLVSSGLLKADVISASIDQLAVSGTVQFDPGASVAINPVTAPPDGTYMLVSGAMPTGTLPAISGAPAGWSLQFGSLELVVGPAPAASTSTTSATTTTRQATQQELQALVAALVKLQEAAVQDEERGPGRDDIVVTDVQCKPA